MTTDNKPDRLTEADIHAGQAVYNRWTLRFYDFVVLNVSNKWIWRCPKEIQLAQYNSYVRSEHLDIGVGTGYYLERTNWPKEITLSLMDINPFCLEQAKQAVHFLSPKIYQADIFKQPDESLVAHFSSISMNYLLHCLPDNMDSKTIVIKNAVDMLKPGGILFGATIVSDPVFQSTMSRTLSGFYNRKKIFSNQSDNKLSLEKTLNQHLENVETEIVGCVALFKGYKK